MNTEKAAVRAVTYLTDRENARLKAEAFLSGQSPAARLREIVRQHFENTPADPRVDVLRGADDSDERIWGQFLRAWHREFGEQKVRPTDLVERAQSGTFHDAFVRDELGDIPNVKKLGRWLGMRVGVTFEGYRVDRIRDSVSKSYRYRVVKMEGTS